MGAAFPSLRPGSQKRQSASFQLSNLKRAAFDQVNIFNAEFQAKIARATAAGKKPGADSFKILQGFSTLFPAQIAAQKAQKKAESQFQATQAKAESDFLARIQEAINKQLASFKAPQVQQTPMIESESQVKQEQPSSSIIPLAIIGAVLLG